MSHERKTILTLFGTRPEIVKCAPVIRALEKRSGLRAVNVSSSQHTDLLRPFVTYFGTRIDEDLNVMQAAQTPADVCARVMTGFDPILARENPSMVLVQGDTTTALAGALACFYRGVPVGHIEAGLRSGDAHSPFPEEMNRRLITKIATLHFAATSHNVQTLLREGVEPKAVIHTGNPVVDALHYVLGRSEDAQLDEIERTGALESQRLIILTTHRRESFGDVMQNNLAVLGEFVRAHEDVALVFPVHPNPSVRAAARAALQNAPRCHLVAPLDYPTFVHLMKRAWLLVSDSGGIQEEAPTLRKPLLILRENTERPEAVQNGWAQLVGATPGRLQQLLNDAYTGSSWINSQQIGDNPFGVGDSGERIATAIEQFLT